MSIKIEEILNFTPPDILYHYASTHSVLGICKSKSIWASNILYLNDYKEYKHAIELIKSELFKQRKDNASTDGEYFDQLNSTLEVIAETEFHVSSQLYLASFSAKGDLLSQWRAYCPPGGGYSLGFNSNELVNIAKQQNYSLVPCIYNEVDQKSLVFDMLHSLHSQYSENWEQNKLMFIGTFLKLAKEIAPMLKHPSFSEEKEWRLVSSPENTATYKYRKYRANNKIFIPYTEIDLKNSQEELHIHKAIVGPSETPELSESSLLGMFQYYGVIIHDIVKSKTPLRINVK